MEYTHAVFIGRFQPPHKSHIEVMRRGLEMADELIIVIGSSRAAPSVKNPFSYAQRVDMIKSELTGPEARRVKFVGVRDYFYSESTWVADIQRQVTALTGGSEQVAIIGAYKDASSYYLRLFPQWDARGIHVSGAAILSATNIRNALFDRPEHESGWCDSVSTPGWGEMVTDNVAKWLKTNFLKTNEFTALQRENDFLKDHHAKWANTPYPVIFVTADAVVLKSGHVLVVQRKAQPGQSLFAVPGGYVRQDETLEDAAVRELKEETRISIDKPVLHKHIVDSHVFDYPGRSLRGRIITHAQFIDLGDGYELPAVKGSDDAAGAMWMPLMDLGANEERFFEDHFHIINYFVTRK